MSPLAKKIIFFTLLGIVFFFFQYGFTSFIAEVLISWQNQTSQ